MEEKQNTNREEQGKEEIPVEVQEASKPLTPETSTPASSEVNEETQRIISEQQITNQQPQTNSMEVHKHPHHVMHKKKWSEYLLEFFMLFLAVFLGFIAENIREKIVEHEREKKYAERLLLDLKTDSASFQKRIIEFKQRQKDQAYFFKTMSAAVKPADSVVYLSFSAILRAWSPQFTTATYNQMKTSGSLRYIRNDELTSELQKYYDVLLPQIDREVTDLRKVFTDHILPYMVKHFRFQDMADSVPAKYLLLNRTIESDQELINIMGAYGFGWDAVFELHQKNLKQDLKLIEIIKKEYNLDDK